MQSREEAFLVLQRKDRDIIVSQQFAVLFEWTEKLSFPEPLLINYFGALTARHFRAVC